MEINHATLDLILVISLGILALCSIIFIVFFIPVLIQLRKTLEALYSLIFVIEKYASGLNNSIDSAKKGVTKIASYVSELFGSFTESITDILFKRK